MSADSFKRSLGPTAGQLENAFAKTPQFQQLRDDYSELATKVRLRPVETAPEREAVSAGAVAGLKPQSEINKIPVGTPPSPKEVGAKEDTRASLREKFRSK